MKNKQHSVIYLTIILFIGIFFSACSKDDREYRVDGYIDFSIEPETNPSNGLFDLRAYVDDSHIRDMNGNWLDPYYINSWSFTDEWAEITNMRIYSPVPAYILWFDVEISGVGTYQYQGPEIQLLGEGDPFFIDDLDFQRFMRQATDLIIRNGGVYVRVLGETNIKGTREPLYFDFFNSMEFYVSR